MLYKILVVIYLVTVILMIIVILLQEPKEGGLSAGIGGAGVENILGVRGAPTFFTKLTAALGAIFLTLSLILSLLHSPAQRTGSVIEKEVKKGGIQLPPIQAPQNPQNQ